MATKLVYIGVVILAIIAIFLGYKIYQQTALNTQPPPSTNQQVKNNPSSQLNSAQQEPPTQITPLVQNIDINTVFKQFPGPNATEEEKTKFNDYLLSIGTEEGTLTINNCKAIPIVFRVKKGSEFMISNLDSVDHTLNVHEVVLSVKAKESQKVKVDNLEGAYGYYCDGAGPRIGILHVVE